MKYVKLFENFSMNTTGYNKKAAIIIRRFRKLFPDFYLEIKEIDIEDVYINVEKRDGQVCISLFHKKYFTSDYFDDANTYYIVKSDLFYKTFIHDIDVNNQWSINSYTSNFKTEKECIEFLIKNGFYTES